MRLGGSTVFSEEPPRMDADVSKELAQPAGLSAPGMAELMAYLREHQFPVDLATTPEARGQELWQSLTEGVQRGAIRYAVPLRAGREFLGVMTLSEHWRSEPF